MYDKPYPGTVWLRLAHAKPCPRYSLAWGMGLPVTPVLITSNIKLIYMLSMKPNLQCLGLREKWKGRQKMYWTETWEQIHKFIVE